MIHDRRRAQKSSPVNGHFNKFKKSYLTTSLAVTLPWLEIRMMLLMLLTVGYPRRLLLLLLLAAPAWLWGRCGRHNSPPARYVMDVVFCRSDGSHVSVDTVHPSLLLSSSLSSPDWYHLQSLSSDVVLVSPLSVAKPPESRFPAPLYDTLYMQSILGVFVSHNMVS